MCARRDLLGARNRRQTKEICRKVGTVVWSEVSQASSEAKKRLVRGSDIRFACRQTDARLFDSCVLSSSVCGRSARPFSLDVGIDGAIENAVEQSDISSRSLIHGLLCDSSQSHLIGGVIRLGKNIIFPETHHRKPSLVGRGSGYRHIGCVRLD